jgi:hypothetical protein
MSTALLSAPPSVLYSSPTRCSGTSFFHRLSLSHNLNNFFNRWTSKKHFQSKTIDILFFSGCFFVLGIQTLKNGKSLSS